MTTVAEEGNRRLGGMTSSEVEQCVFDIKSWFIRSGVAERVLEGAPSAEIQRLEKAVDVAIPPALKTLLLETDGGIYFFDKKLFSSSEIAEHYASFEGSKVWRRSLVPVCGDESAMLVVDTANDGLYEWDADDGLGDMEAASFSAYLERYRNMLLGGQCDFVKDLGVVEKLGAGKRK